MLSVITDAANFAVGGVIQGANTAGSWGRWAFGYDGDAFNQKGQFSHFRIGGGLAIALVVGLMAGPAAALGLYAMMLVGGVVLGAMTGFVGGGLSAMQAGRDRRQEAQRERLMARAEALQQMQDEKPFVSAQDAAHHRHKNAGFVAREEARRALAAQAEKGMS